MREIATSMECVALGDDEPESRKVVHIDFCVQKTFVFRPGQYVVSTTVTSITRGIRTR